VFTAFGETGQVMPDGIFLNKKKQTGVKGILISLDALADVGEYPSLKIINIICPT
jgi:hypothetical protein